MNFTAAVSDFFKSPKWILNLLLGTLCLLIPIAGVMAVLGWLIICFWGRHQHDHPAGFPPFELGRLGQNISRGAIPIAANLVAALILAPLSVIVFYILPSMGFVHLADGGVGNRLVAILMYALGTAVWLGFFMLTAPITLRASLTQEFGNAFNVPFARRFIISVKKELLLTAGFMAALSALTAWLGWRGLTYVSLFLGPVTLYAWQHLLKQLYQLYLYRGGQPIPVSPVLVEEQRLAA